MQMSCLLLLFQYSEVLQTAHEFLKNTIIHFIILPTIIPTCTIEVTKTVYIRHNLYFIQMYSLLNSSKLSAY